jgi:CDP-glucose 4,6-dehydratase
LEDVVSASSSPWRDRTVLVTGHTGFKGTWLSLWLSASGARVHGYALDPPTEPSLFAVSGVASRLSSDTRANIADYTALKAAFDRTSPEVVFHLAAQPLVRESYTDPVTTFATNVMGTAHVLEASRKTASVQAVVVVTTDKVYANDESGTSCVESDPLGGHDPYSASKAAAEIVAASYRASFFAGTRGHRARVATVRAGNVIGGGDWAVDRLVPDCLKAFETGQPVVLRYPNAVRPWQHVLEPLSGYLKLAEGLLSQAGSPWARAWNFGPRKEDECTVREVAELAAALWGKGARVSCSPDEAHPHETGLLRLDSTAASAHIGWTPRWSIREALEQTVAWQQAWRAGDDMGDFSLRQIRAYQGPALQ